VGAGLRNMCQYALPSASSIESTAGAVWRLCLRDRWETDFFLARRP
jgi:hypothetical protein